MLWLNAVTDMGAVALCADAAAQAETKRF